jgi:hypothetical protein
MGEWKYRNARKGGNDSALSFLKAITFEMSKKTYFV